MDVVRLGSNQEFTVVGKICDRCGLRVSDESNYFEFQEFVRIQIDAGYGGKFFYDGDFMQCDLCEKCAHALLGPYLRTIASFEDRSHAIDMQTHSDHRASGGRIILRKGSSLTSVRQND